MWAANRGALDAVRALLRAGADTGVRADDGWTAREAAEMLGDTEILRLLESR